MHPNFVVYNPRTLMKLREAVGEEIGANCDLSHLFWQGCDPVEVIHFLGKQGAIFHAHMKDTVLFPGERRQVWGIELRVRYRGSSASVRDVSRGGLRPWRELMEVDREGVHGYGVRRASLSIENEDPILTGTSGRRARSLRSEECARTNCSGLDAVARTDFVHALR